MKTLLASLLVLVLACSHPPLTQYEQAELAKPGVTILVTNSGLDPMRVYTTHGGVDQYLGSVMTAETRCFTVYETTTRLQMKMKTMNGTWYSYDFVPRDAPAHAWTWKIGMSPKYESQSLIPARGKCMR